MKYNLLFIILLFFFLYSCSSETDDTASEEILFEITNISPLTGQSGDVINVTWSGFNEVINSSIIRFNGVDSQINSIEENELTCVVPNNATSGNIQLILNGTEALSTEDFIIDTTQNNQNFYIDNVMPSLPRPGYEMIIVGSGFGNSDENVTVAFMDVSDTVLEAKILEVSDSQIRLVVPTNAVSSDVSVTIISETVTVFQNIAEIMHKGLYFFQDGLIRTFNYNIDNYMLLANYSANVFYDELYSFTYNPSQDTFYGFNHLSDQTNTKLRYFGYNDTSNQWNVNLICNTTSGGSVCSNDFAVVTNTLTNKNYYINRYENTFTGLSFNEINSNGEVLVQYDFPNINTIGFSDNNILFIESINSFIFVENSYDAITLHSVDASTFTLTSHTLSGTIDYVDELFSEICYNKFENQLYVARADDIYNIDFANFTVERLNTNWFEYINTGSYTNSQPWNFIYYEPTNDFYIEALIPNEGPRIFAINLLTKETRSIHGSSYGSGGRVFNWVLKD
ncbi:IPT/TIG domain-containing protein [Winogradskyella ouciana]|uniref:IPT/TIG domain-containing protein n=1 Tax=Winogradskyella ouciana TaxID=2608631 RepID=UPI003D2E1244